VLWTVFVHSTGTMGTLRLLQSYTKEDLKNIQKIKTKCITYKNTFKQDKIIAKTKITTTSTVLKMYSKGELSVFYFWWYFNQHEPEGRIQTRMYKRVDFLLDYFPLIKKEILIQV